LLAVTVSVDSGDREWLVEQRYRAVLEVLDGSPVGEVAVRYGVSRQAVHAWKGKYLRGGIEALRLTDQITSPPLRTASHAYQIALDNLTRTTGLAA
jgi:transposase